MVETIKVKDAFEKVKITVPQKVFESFISCIKDYKGSIKILDLLQLLNEKDAEDLFNANIEQLENGTWKKNV